MIGINLEDQGSRQCLPLVCLDSSKTPLCCTSTPKCCLSNNSLCIDLHTPDNVVMEFIFLFKWFVFFICTNVCKDVLCARVNVCIYVI